jgi:4-amino-4-deoxy-L-arabinose transferase-like glycosyltransferase
LLLSHKLFFVWLCFVCRGIFYCSLLPLWDGFDEWAHFAVIERMATSKSPLIDRNDPVSREIDASLALAPLPRGMTSIPIGGVVRDKYWQLPPEERARREYELAHLPPHWSAEYPGGGMPAYEASQSPLYYWLLAVPAMALREVPLVDRVWLTRIITVLAGSLCIPIGYLAARRFFRDAGSAVGVTIAIALLPELALTLSRVSNESLAVVLSTALVLVAMGWVETPKPSAAIAVGILLGLSLLTKAYALTAIPALIVIYLWKAIANPRARRAIFWQAVLTLTLAAAISGWWYARTYLQTGTMSGLDEALMLKNIGTMEKLRGVLDVDWWPALRTVLLSHVWYGGWNLVGLPRWLDLFWLAVMTVTFYGFLRSRPALHDSRAVLLLSFYVFFWLGQAYQVAALFLSKGSSTAMGGWYLYSVIWAEVLLGTVAIRSLVPTGWRGRAFNAILIAIAVTDLYGLHAELIRYYARPANGGALELSRLLLNQPHLLGGYGLGILWFIYIAATVALVIMGLQSSKRYSAL